MNILKSSMTTVPRNVFRISMMMVFWLTCSAQQSELTIRIVQDQRVEHSTELYAYLKSKNERERELALLAIANIRDTSAIDAVALLLSDDSPKVRSMAAFTVGMIGSSYGAALLLKQLPLEQDLHVVSELFNGIGLSGTKEDLKQIINQIDHFPAQWHSSILQTILRFANRKISDSAATQYTASFLSDSTNNFNAVYAFMRINDTIAIRIHREQIYRLLLHPSPEIRMWSATMMGVTEDTISFHYLLARALTDSDWRVQVNAIRSLRTTPLAKENLMELFSDKNEHVALSAVAAYDVLTSKEVRFSDSSDFISIIRSTKYFPSVTEEIRKLFAKKLGSSAIPLIGNWQSSDPYISTQRVRAYGETRSPNALPKIVEAIDQSTNALVLIAGIEAYQNIARSANDSIQKEFLKLAVSLFEKKDAGISYTSAVAFQDTSFNRELRKTHLSDLFEAYKTMCPPADLEPMVELLNVFGEIADSTAIPVILEGLEVEDNAIRIAAERAYTSITGKKPSFQLNNRLHEYRPFYTKKELMLLYKYHGADISTSKGRISVSFEKEAAPFTVLNFILLAEKKFYDGLSFHRVVSNFVIQGGDPLGNGSGGPNYAVRTEIHPNRTYKTGAVGMASAGKDTEGSQWFITHCPTPHLDFRYTVFGYTQDSATVNKIMVGDTIRSVRLF